MWERVIIILQFYLRAGTIYNVQSKFMFDFVVNVLDDRDRFYAFAKVEQQRQLLLKTALTIDVVDHGAGSHHLKGNQRSVKSIARNSLSPRAKSEILFKIVNYYDILRTLELGTSLGISSAYLAIANIKNTVYTLEGDHNILTIAKKVHLKLALKNIKCYEGRFDQNIAEVLEEMKRVDLAFIDGHHSEKPTIAYYEQILPYCHEGSIIILDDIHWSASMYNAWANISGRKEVTLAIELMDIGVVFLDPKLSKQQVAYVPHRWKPWKIGLFG